MSAPTVSARDVRVTFGTGIAAVHALKSASLDVRAGEILMLIGPSGSGKTTLLQVMGALLRPTAGTVRLMGERIDDLDQAALGRLRLKHFGFVFQGYNLFPTLTAAENVALAEDLKGVPAGARGMEEALALLNSVGLGDRAGHFPSQLSGGQKQRVAIARALAGKPDVLFADEPTAALDSGSGARVISLLQGLARAQTCAVLIVTHDARILRYADRIVSIEDGLIGAEHMPAEMERPAGQ